PALPRRIPSTFPGVMSRLDADMSAQHNTFLARMRHSRHAHLWVGTLFEMAAVSQGAHNGQRALAFLAGVGFAAVPAAGPFLALLTWLNQRLDIQRADRLWWAAALLLSAPFVVTGHVTAGLGTAAQVL